VSESISYLGAFSRDYDFQWDLKILALPAP
jgi:hypothetical protein